MPVRLPLFFLARTRRFGKSGEASEHAFRPSCTLVDILPTACGKTPSVSLLRDTGGMSVTLAGTTIPMIRRMRNAHAYSADCSILLPPSYAYLGRAQHLSAARGCCLVATFHLFARNVNIALRAIAFILYLRLYLRTDDGGRTEAGRPNTLFAVRRAQR